MNIKNRDQENIPNEQHELSEFILSETEANGTIKNISTADDENEKPNIHGDRANIVLITFLYFSQGIVWGLSAAIPLLLQKYNATYTQQAIFSMCSWPYGCKLLWAPIVDSLYSDRLGRRKSWMIPNQFLIGGFMVVMSYNIDLWLSGDGSKNPNVQILTIFFSGLHFVTATQDIALDGWAIQMVKRRNVGYVATCNQSGFKSGFFIGFSLFIALESAEFCNKNLRSVPQTIGLVTLPDFLWYWGLCFLCTTILIAFLKRESANKNQRDNLSSSYSKFSIINSYKILYNILKKPSIQLLIFISLTSRFAYAVCDNVVNLKLLDAGVPKDNLFVLMTMSIIPTGIILPLIISKYTSGPKPTETYVGFIPFRTLLCIAAVFLVWQAPNMIFESGETSFYLLFLLLVQYILYDSCVNSMNVAITAFFAQISDPRVGSTYMTLCNTFENLGAAWGTISLWMVDVLTWTECDYKNGFSNITSSNSSGTFFNSTGAVNYTIAAVSPVPNTVAPHCRITIDGFYIEAIICLIYGIIWYFWAKSKIRYLQQLPTKIWFLANEN